MARRLVRLKFIISLSVTAVLLGLAVAWFIARGGAEIQQTTPLLMESLPRLEHIASLQAAVHDQQVLLNQYYAATISRDIFLKQNGAVAADMQQLLVGLQQGSSNPGQIHTLLARCAALQTQAQQLDAAMQRRPVDQAAAKQVLHVSASVGNDVSTQLLQLESEVRRRLYTSTNLLSHHAEEMTRAVYLYGLASVILVLLAAYHVYTHLQTEAEYAFQASHDLLTGLRNRRRLEETLHELSAHPESCHVLIVYLDRFRRITAGLGREISDDFLRSAAERLSTLLSPYNARLFRYEGVSFAVLCPTTSDGPTAQALADTLRQGMLPPFQLLRNELFATVSIGSAIYPQDGHDPATLIRNADAALQMVRSDGGDGFQPYTPQINIRALERLALEAQLRHALAGDELELFFQPQLSLSADRLVGVECLLRWRQNGKFISPAEFIPLAEESGLIVPIGAWVLKTACKQSVAWRDAGLPPLLVAVNISAKQFQHPDFLNVVAETLQETGADAGRIEIEITESVVMQDAEQTTMVLDRLRDMGLQLSIDDFGTGYSSLAYLKRFPIHKIKIDQSFIRGLAPGSGDAAIVEAVIQLGHSLGLMVIAEGVETQAELDYLKSCDCDEIQGYFYGRPQPEPVATAFIDKEAQRTAAR